MFHPKNHDTSSPKCYFTASVLPRYLDHAQLPLKKRPFSTICDQPFNHTLNIVLPAGSSEKLKKSLDGDDGALHYTTVYMKLGDLVEGDFFNHYIKTGNILMLSEGRVGIDPTFSLSEGVLRIEIDKPTFERTGLEGKVIRSDGRKHVKTRYAIELNLRLPSTVRGKHGFERIVWAFRNVLNQSLKWLFYDFEAPNDGSGPIATHQPTAKVIQPQVEVLAGMEVPNFGKEVSDKDYEYVSDLLEWLTLAIAGSPRLQHTDSMDPIMSRYRVPAITSADPGGAEELQVQDLVKFEWRGLIPPAFVQKILLAAIKASGDHWLALNVNGFDGKAYIVLQHGEHTTTWEYED